MLQIVNYAESYRNQNIYQLKGFYKLEAKKKSTGGWVQLNIKENFKKVIGPSFNIINMK
jgi:hypothetical protein